MKAQVNLVADHGIQQADQTADSNGAAGESKKPRKSKPKVEKKKYILYLPRRVSTDVSEWAPKVDLQDTQFIQYAVATAIDKLKRQEEPFTVFAPTKILGLMLLNWFDSVGGTDEIFSTVYSSSRTNKASDTVRGHRVYLENSLAKNNPRYNMSSTNETVATRLNYMKQAFEQRGLSTDPDRKGVLTTLAEEAADIFA